MTFASSMYVSRSHATGTALSGNALALLKPCSAVPTCPMHLQAQQAFANESQIAHKPASGSVRLVHSSSARKLRARYPMDPTGLATTGRSLRAQQHMKISIWVVWVHNFGGEPKLIKSERMPVAPEGGVV